MKNIIALGILVTYVPIAQGHAKRTNSTISWIKENVASVAASAAVILGAALYAKIRTINNHHLIGSSNNIENEKNSIGLYQLNSQGSQSQPVSVPTNDQNMHTPRNRQFHQPPINLSNENSSIVIPLSNFFSEEDTPSTSSLKTPSSNAPLDELSNLSEEFPLSPRIHPDTLASINNKLIYRYCYSKCNRQLHRRHRRFSAPEFILDEIM